MVSEWRINEYRVLKTSSVVKNVFFPQLPRKHEDQGALVAFKKVLTTVTDLKCSFSDLGNKSGNVHYYFEVEFNFWNDW